MNPRRRVLCFSLRTLLFAVMLIGSGTTLWWHWAPWALEHRLREHMEVVTFSAFSPDGRRIITNSSDKTCIWDSETGALKAQLGPGSLDSAEFSIDGQRIVISDGPVCVWNTDSGKLETELDGRARWPVSYDGRKNILAAGDDSTVCLWDADTGKSRGVLQSLGGLDSARISPDGHRFLTWGQTVTIWDADTLKPLTELKGIDEGLCSFAFSPDCHRVITTSCINVVKIWDVDTGKQLTELNGHRAIVNPSAYAPDGRRFVTATMEGRACVWDSETYKLLAVFKGQCRISSAAFSSDNHRIVTVGENNLSIWDADNGTILAKFPTLTFNNCAFSRDVQRIVTVNMNENDANPVIYHRRHPEYWWGVAWLPEFWLTVIFAGAFVWSLWMDRRDTKVCS